MKQPEPTPRISVLTGVRNGEHLIESTWAGLQGQMFSDWEWIVVDDASTDGTRRWLESRAKEDPRVRIFSAQGDGLTQALQQASALARGAYLARHDAGDCSHPARFLRQKQALDSLPGVGFVSCATRFVGPEGEEVRVEPGCSHPGVPTKILQPAQGPGKNYSGPSHHGSVMMRNEALLAAGGYRAPFYFGQDWDLWYRLIEAWEFLALEEVLYEARLDPDGISLTRRSEQERFAILGRAAASARRADGGDQAVMLEAAALAARCRGKLIRRGCGMGNYFLGESLRRNGDPSAKKYLAKALLARWWDPRVWLRWGMALALRNPRQDWRH